MPKSSTQKEIEDRLNIIGIKYEPFVYIGKKTRINYFCSQCGNIKNGRYDNITLCKECGIKKLGNLLTLTQKEIEDRLDNKNIIYNPFIYIGYNKTKIEYKCTSCGNWKNNYIRTILGGGSTLCKECGEKYRNKTKWFKENVIEESKKYKTRSEFAKYSGSAYRVAIKDGYLDECCKHMKIQGNIKYRLNYIYLFPEHKRFYNGITYNIEKRDIQHRNNENSQVYKFSKIMNIPIPKPLILFDFLPIDEACKKEKEVNKKYKNKNWLSLNKIECGNPGGNNLKYTYEICKKEILKYNNITEFRRKNISCYEVTRIKYPQLLNNLNRLRKSPGWWTHKRCKMETLKHKTIKELKKNNDSCYHIILKKYPELLKKFNKLQRNPYTFDECKTEALKYESRNEFRDKNTQTYKAACRKKWIDEITKHMIYKLDNQPKKVVQLTRDYTYIKTHKTINQASKETNIHSGSICWVCKNKLKTAGGFIWMYYYDYIKLEGNENS
jgi:predicted GIY-YIG superfamily endonuclease/DNA-directed RNA polymerase subunit RPC12/RpoP